jgi:homoserine kinase
MSVRVFAPATVANVAVGFDILGFAVEGVGDEIIVERIPEPQVLIGSVTGLKGKIPVDPQRNAASVAVESLRRALGLKHGFRVSVQKGIPLASGMGGSAASSVGAVVGANALLDRPLPLKDLLAYALEGERETSGASHPDNAAACLHGGLVLALPHAMSPGPGPSAPEIVKLPIPQNIRCVLVHPHVEVETRASRAILRPQVTLPEHVAQSARLAGFVAACAAGDLALLRRSLGDDLIEPQRRHLITGFDAAKAAALEAGALGFSISGSGPSVFAWVAGDAAAHAVRDAIVRAFAAQDVATDVLVSALPADGARILSKES